MKRIIVKAAAAVTLLAAGFGTGIATASQAATAHHGTSGNDAVIVCFANSSLTAQNGTLESQGSGVWILDHPTYYSGTGTLGGMLVNGGFNQGQC